MHRSQCMSSPAFWSPVRPSLFRRRWKIRASTPARRRSCSCSKRGEEEYDLSRYPSQNVYLETPDYDELSPEFLEGLRRKYNAERVVAELNGMHQAADFYMKTPDSWVIAQEVMFADAQTFQGYNANMRQLVVDKLMGASWSCSTG